MQSCVTYWHSDVCLEYHWVLCHVLKNNNKKKTAVCVKKKKKKKKLSPCLALCSQPELDEYSHGEKYKRDAASTEVSSFLYILFLCDCSLFFYLVTKSHWSRCIHDRLYLGSGYSDDHALYLVSTQLCDKCTWSTWLLLCIRTACLCVMCLFLWKGRRLAVCLLPSSWNLSVPLGNWAQVYRTAEAALTAQLISFGARHAALPLAAWTGFVPFLPLYIHKLYI